MDRGQSTLFPERSEDWIGKDNAVRVIDGFVEELDLAELGFTGVDPGTTAKPGSAFGTLQPNRRRNIRLHLEVKRARNADTSADCG